jgi:hypothetical protein
MNTRANTNNSNMNAHETHSIRRLDQIEEKIDKLADLVILIARAEERVINLEADSRNSDALIKEIEDKIVCLEICVNTNSMTVDATHKLMWILLTGLIGSFITYITTVNSL